MYVTATQKEVMCLKKRSDTLKNLERERGGGMTHLFYSHKSQNQKKTRNNSHFDLFCFVLKTGLSV